MQSQADPEMEIDRSTTRIHAQKDIDGKFRSEKVKEIALNIVGYSLCYIKILH